MSHRVVAWRRICVAIAALALLLPLHATAKDVLSPHAVMLADGRSFDLNLPAGLAITPALQGLHRVRFFARSPDDRIFVTDMHDLSDNSLGVVYILDGWDAAAGTFSRAIPYLSGLRNPNSVAFFTDAARQQWIYIAQTDRLVRYRYVAGDLHPGADPEVIATFPDYGLSYKYGGWHLTRTVVFGDNGKLYVSVGSSCNACVEKESVRASVLEMDPDGSHSRIYARGLRNAVWMAWRDGRLVATNQGADHLGHDRPDETMYRIADGADYGWPYCYLSSGKVRADPKFPRRSGCSQAPRAFAHFQAHGSALGFDYFPGDSGTPAQSTLLHDDYLVALHGSTNSRIGHGYKLVRVGADGRVHDFITGFLVDGKVNGRPCGVLRMGPDAFLFTDDKSGVIYYVRPRS